MRAQRRKSSIAQKEAQEALSGSKTVEANHQASVSLSASEEAAEMPGATEEVATDFEDKRAELVKRDAEIVAEVKERNRRCRPSAKVHDLVTREATVTELLMLI